MKIEISDDVGAVLKARALGAGYSDPADYLARLLGLADDRVHPDAGDALERIRRLRDSAPRMTREEVVDLIHEGRERCP